MLAEQPGQKIPPSPQQIELLLIYGDRQGSTAEKERETRWLAPTTPRQLYLEGGVLSALKKALGPTQAGSSAESGGDGAGTTVMLSGSRLIRGDQ